MVGNEDNGRAGGYKGKVQAAYRAVNAEEGNTYPRGSGRDRGRHDTPAASGLCREVGGTLRNTHVPNLHAQGRRSQRLGRERGNMEAELPCAHDFRLDGRGNGEDPEAEQAGHGGNAGPYWRNALAWKGAFLPTVNTFPPSSTRIWSKRRKTAQIEKECRKMENERNAIEDEVKLAGEKLEDAKRSSRKQPLK